MDRNNCFITSGGRSERFINQSGVKDFDTMDDMSCAVDYLVAPGARFVTGQTVVADGGLTANLAELDPISTATRKYTNGLALT